MRARNIHRQRGFTLIEILIVAALIALFAGIAVFNIQEMYSNNVRKAAMSESRNLGTACAMAQDDLGFIPKFNYLLLPEDFIVFFQGSDIQLRGEFDFMGFYGNPNLDFEISTDRVRRSWPRSGFLAMSQSRGGANRGEGGFTRMQLRFSELQASSEESIVEWPADPWGNPWVLYQLKGNRLQDGSVNDGSTEPLWEFIDSPTEAADYARLVVSYGPNGAPGAIVRNSGEYSGYGDPNVITLREVTPEMDQARLYTDAAAGSAARFQALIPGGYEGAQGLHRAFALRGPGVGAATNQNLVGPWQARFPVDQFGEPGRFEYRGVMDEGSDDIVFEF